jgi:YVTN family beta-propeller protein
MLSPLYSKYSFSLVVLVLIAHVGNCYGAIQGYIPNSLDNNLSVINKADSTDVNIIGPLGKTPTGVATSLTGDFIYVTNNSSNTVSQINSQAGTIFTHTVGTGPVGIAVGPDGTYVYVANQDGTLSVIDITDNTIESVEIGTSLYGIAVNPDLGTVFLTDDTDNQVYEIDPDDLSISNSFTVGVSPKGIAIDQAGKYVVVANSADDTVSVISVDINSVSEPIDVGSSPFGVAFTNDDNYAYVTNNGDDSVSKIALDDFSVTTVELAPGEETQDSPQGLSVSPFGEALYVINNKSDIIKVVNIEDDTVDDTIFMVGNAPIGIGKFFFSEAPQNLTATLVGDRAIDLSWTDNSDFTTGFTIERRQYTTGTFSEIATVNADVTTYSDVDLDYYSNYYYRVKTISDTGSSLFSNIDFVQTVEEPEEEFSGCFIATAAYGSTMEPHVIVLRYLRDEYLLTNNLGIKFVEAYYKHSPPVADFIADHDGLRFAIRVGLAPLVGFIWLAMNYGVIPALMLFISICSLMIGLTGILVRSRKTAQ